MSMVRQEVEDLGLFMIELESGGWGVMPSKGLQGAPAITAKKHISDTLAELKKRPTKVFESIRDELEDDVVSFDEEG